MAKYTWLKKKKKAMSQAMMPRLDVFIGVVAFIVFIKLIIFLGFHFQ